MKYIHGGTIKKKTSGGAVVRIVFGSIFLFISIIVLIAATSNSSAIVANIIGFWPASFLFLFFGIRSAVASSGEFPQHNLDDIASKGPNDPFFTTRCERCGLVFDYQYSDLGFRAWYRDGYVDCPRCEQHLRHNATTNEFSADEILPTYNTQPK